MAARVPDSDFELGERYLLPLRQRPYRRNETDPIARPLWVYMLDPAAVGLRHSATRIDVPFEPLAPGPVGAMLAVAHGPLPDWLLQRMDWPRARADAYARSPLDLNRVELAIDGGIRPTTGNPLFAGQMSYAVCHQVYRTFATALGRAPTWGPWSAAKDSHGRLEIHPFALPHTANAEYDPDSGRLNFGVFRANQTPSPYVLPGGLIFLALSQDIVAHEMTHALLDGMRAKFMLDTHVDVAAFHEGFADIVALLHHFLQPALVAGAIEEHAGLNADALLQMARQFGEGGNGPQGGALRRAIEQMDSASDPPDKVQRCHGSRPSECHDRGSILVSAVFEAFLLVFARRAKPLFDLANLKAGVAGQRLPKEIVPLLTDECARLAQHFLNICIRAVDYCPPLDLHFGEYLRAIVTADRELVPDDRYGYRELLIRAFRRRNIEFEHVMDLSEDSLAWLRPSAEPMRIEALSRSNLRLDDSGEVPNGEREMRRQAQAFADYFLGDAQRLRSLGLRPAGGDFGPVVLETLRVQSRRDDTGRIAHGIVAEVTQERRRGRTPFTGGATVILGEDGTVRYTVRKRVDDLRRKARQEKHQAAHGAGPTLTMRRLHEGRFGRSGREGDATADPPNAADDA